MISLNSRSLITYLQFWQDFTIIYQHGYIPRTAFTFYIASSDLGNLAKIPAVIEARIAYAW
jgi:hypothetical protein